MGTRIRFNPNRLDKLETGSLADPQTRAYKNLACYNEVDRGGRFAAWEHPALFTAEMRAAFRPLRAGA